MVYVSRDREDEGVPRSDPAKTLDAAVRPHGGPYQMDSPFRRT